MPDVESSLENFLTAMQKSFSRVSASASGVSPSAPRALIMGQVKFSLALRGRFADDHVLIDPEGPVQVELAGTIEQDVREQASDIAVAKAEVTDLAGEVRQVERFTPGELADIMQRVQAMARQVQALSEREGTDG